MKKCANKIICVSNYVSESLPYKELPTCVIYNPIFIHNLTNVNDIYLLPKYNNKIILMPTSLKEYKGINIFLQIARKLSKLNFILICSTSLVEVQKYFSNFQIPNNLKLLGQQTDLYKYYCDASITINLSLPDKWIETFGLTIIEGFDTCTPAIAPNYGGPKEIIDNEINGLLINPYNLEEVENSINKIMNEYNIYKKYALEARKKTSKYSITNFNSQIITNIEDLLQK